MIVGATELLTQQDFKRVAVDIDIEPKVSPSKTKSKGMSQNYEFRSLEYVDEDNQDNQSEALTVFETGDTKTIDFVKKDGTRQSFPYGHYMTAWYEKKKDTNEWAIKIFFATHLVTISGFSLEKIYDELRQFSFKIIDRP